MAEIALQQSDAGSWLQWITDFDRTYKQFNDNYNALISLKSYIYTRHPELRATYDNLVSRGNEHAATLKKLKATRDYVYSWLNWLGSGIKSGVDFIGSEAQSAYDYAKKSLGLGALPVVIIGIAAASAALVLIGYWIKDAYAFAQRLNALKTQEDILIKQGVSPEAAATRARDIVNNVLGPSGGDINKNLLGIPWGYIIGGAILIFLGPPLIEALSGEKRHGR